MLQIENHNNFELSQFNNDHQLNLSRSTINTINNILDKINPILQFSTHEIISIINQFIQMDELFPNRPKSPPWTVHRVFISILFLQSKNPEMRSKRHIDLYTLDRIFDYCDIKTYNLKNLKKTLRSINFDWTDLLYSYEEGFTYYSLIIFYDERIRLRIKKNKIDPDVYSNIIHGMFSFLISSASWKLRSELNATLIQFVLKSIQTFSEIIDKELSKSDWFSPMRIERDDIISIIGSELSMYPNISGIYVGNILSEKKSRRLQEYIFSLEKDFVKLIRKLISELNQEGSY